MFPHWYWRESIVLPEGLPRHEMDCLDTLGRQSRDGRILYRTLKLDSCVFLSDCGVESESSQPAKTDCAYAQGGCIASRYYAPSIMRGMAGLESRGVRPGTSAAQIVGGRTRDVVHRSAAEYTSVGDFPALAQCGIGRSQIERTDSG